MALLNAMAGLAFGVSAFFLPVSALNGDWVGVVAVALSMVWLLGVLWMQARGRVWGAALALSLTAVLPIDVQMATQGIQLGGQFYLLPAALLPFLVFPPGHSAAAVAVSLLSSLSLIVDLALVHDHASYLALFASEGVGMTLIHAAIAAMMGVLGVFARRIILAAEGTAERERARSEALLTRVFPRAIARRLKHGGKVAAERYGDVSVLFCRVVGLEQRGGPVEQLALLRELFAAFDDLCVLHGVEKIKSFGESYMVASGVPEPQADHAERLAALALGLRAAGTGLGARLGVRLRVGMHSGPVVGGVLGSRRQTFDLWGDTVNTAQRMEAHGVDGEVQISQVSFSKINHRFVCAGREPIELKGKLAVRTYLLRGLLAEAGR